MFNTSSSPIRSIADIYAVYSAAIIATGYFAPGYLESQGEAIIGPPSCQIATRGMSSFGRRAAPMA